MILIALFIVIFLESSSTYAGNVIIFDVCDRVTLAQLSIYQKPFIYRVNAL